MSPTELSEERLHLLHQELAAQLAAGDVQGAQNLVASLHPVDAAWLTAALDREERLHLMQLLSGRVAAGIVERLPESDQISLVGGLHPEVASGIIKKMDSDDAADVLADLPKDKSDAILAAMPVADASRARALIAYPENTAGSIMATEFIALDEALSVQEAIKDLQRQYARLGDERATYAYTVGQYGVLSGVLQLRHLGDPPAGRNPGQIEEFGRGVDSRGHEQVRGGPHVPAASLHGTAGRG